MQNNKLSDEAIIDAIRRYGSGRKAAIALGIPRTTLQDRVVAKVGDALELRLRGADLATPGGTALPAAYEAYLRNSDVASLLPCNAVLRDVGDGRISIELAKPSSLMEMLGDRELIVLARDADARLQRALEAV